MAQPEAREAARQRLHVYKAAPLAVCCLQKGQSKAEDENSGRSPR